MLNLDRPNLLKLDMFNLDMPTSSLILIKLDFPNLDMHLLKLDNLSQVQKKIRCYEIS